MNYPKNRYSKENPCKDRNWLYNEYVVLDKSTKQIATEIGCNRNTVQCYLSKYKIKKDIVKREPVVKKQYQSKDYLYNEHFINHKPISDIARENNVSIDTILYFFNKNELEYIPLRNKTILSQEEENDIVERYLNGESSVQIGDVCGVSNRLILRVLNRHNIKRRTLSESQYNYLEKEYPKELQDRDWLYTEYIINKRSSVDIANELNVSPSTIIRNIKSFGIQLRGDSESKIGILVGKNHPNYKGGITPLNRLLREFFNINIAPKVAKRDNYTCQICGKTHTILHVHHIKAFSEIVHEILLEHKDLTPESDKYELYDIIVHDERFLDLANLITYCKDCHIAIHSKKSISNQASLNEEGSETIQ